MFICYFLFFTLTILKMSFNEDFVYAEYMDDYYATNPFYDLTKEQRLSLALLGLKAVLNDRDFMIFNNSLYFTQKEKEHMYDVKELLKMFFIIRDIAFFMFLIAFLICFLKYYDVNYLLKLLIKFHLLNVTILLITLIFSAIFPRSVSLGLHYVLFYSKNNWRFGFWDLIVNIYPQRFWFNATIYFFTLSITLNIFYAIMLKYLKTIKSMTSNN